jgi:hypothetical protein
MLRLLRRLRRPVSAEDRALIAALVECTGAVLSATEFLWQADDGMISVTGLGRMAGHGVVIALTASWPTYLPHRLKVKAMARMYMKDVQRLASKAAGEPWPVESARCHVRVTRSGTDIWWTARWSRTKLVEVHSEALTSRVA